MIEWSFAAAVVAAMVLFFMVMRAWAVRYRNKRKPYIDSGLGKGHFAGSNFDGSRDGPNPRTLDSGGSDSGGDGGGGGD